MANLHIDVHVRRPFHTILYDRCICYVSQQNFYSLHSENFVFSPHEYYFFGILICLSILFAAYLTYEIALNLRHAISYT
jgi:hypothetical protein